MRIPIFSTFAITLHLSITSSAQNLTHFEWKTDRWGPCSSESGCGIGKRERQVDCLRRDEAASVEELHCHHVPKPASLEKCFHVCEKLKPLLWWSVGSWSPCVPHKDQLSRCSSSGISTRRVQCLYKDQDDVKVVPETACEHFWIKPQEATACSYECPQDCIVSESTCRDNTSCSVQERSTKVVVAPEPGGLSCPIQNMTLCLNSECLSDDYSDVEYTIKMGDWGPCLNANSQTDSLEVMNGLSLEPKIGITERSITCLNSIGETVSISLCPSSVREAVQRQRCLVPRECELSPWSTWRVTKEGCINSLKEAIPEIRRRTRDLVRPALGNGLPCGPLFEMRTSTQGLLPCTKYTWFPLSWGECVVFHHKDLDTVQLIHPTCGGGVQVRKIICLRIPDSTPVEDSKCLDPKPAIVQRCEVPCIRDCQVSSWSKWGQCLPFDSVTDFNELHLNGYKKRIRSIVVSPSFGGSACPHLEESDSCSDVSVAKWIYGNWSDCRLLDRSSRCGPGEKTRDYSCVTYEGSPISEIFCEKHASYRKTTESCRLPCPDDCTLSEWSEWSKCPSASCSADGSVVPRMHRNRTVVGIKGDEGSNCHDDRRESNPCRLQSCSLTKWITSEWSECLMIRAEAVCGEGRQIRDIYCQLGDSTQKDETKCRNLDRPMDTRQCYKDCPQDCVLTNFSEWSLCPTECKPGSSRSRTRYIQKTEKNGGQPCPGNLTESVACASENDVDCDEVNKASYRWKTGLWGPCHLPDINAKCGTGFQIRSISCVEDSEKLVEMHHCLSQTYSGGLLDVIAAVPQAFRLCQITCHDGHPSCIHSAWTSWSSCIHKYKAKRMRTRELIGSSGTDPFCVERFTLTEEDDCPFLNEELSSIEPSWSSCILEDSNGSAVAVNGERVLNYCGTGYRYKVGLQVKDVDLIEPGIERDLCLIDCPVDCLLSEWSKWTECDVPCGQGYRRRHRKVIVPSNDLGRTCSDATKNITEIDVCQVPCNEYRWHAAGWSKCNLFSRDDTYQKCGNGTQTRTVECLKKNTDESVDSAFCDPISKPLSLLECKIACPGECIISDWYIWKTCRQPCTNDNFMEKRRDIIRHAVATQACPHPLSSNESCILNINCFEYSWHIGDWASCVLPNGASCGDGIRKRPLACKRSDGRQVDLINCKKLTESPSLKNVLSEPCYQDCPIDCIVSAWSKWNDSQCLTNFKTFGVLTRHRTVIEAASESGQPCPTEMEQKQPCPYKTRYHWKTFDWSSCDLQGANCGFGVRRRLVACIRYDGLQVDKMHCLASNLTFTIEGWLDPKWLTLALDKAEEEDCYVRCHGDCILSEWSSWSDCHKNCRMGQTIGYQTSSRTLILPSSSSKSNCPSNMWRTRPCWGNRCISYKWKFKNKALICEGSDGSVVTGGCSKLPRPCFKSCELFPGGKCNTRWGACFCKNSAGRLVPVVDAAVAQRKCRLRTPSDLGPKRPANHTASSQEIHLKYYPDDNQVSFWMYAMISTGSAFVIFVVVTIYLMCSNSGQST